MNCVLRVIIPNAVDSGLNHTDGLSYHICDLTASKSSLSKAKGDTISGYRHKAVFYDKQKYKEHAMTEVTSE